MDEEQQVPLRGDLFAHLDPPEEDTARGQLTGLGRDLRRTLEPAQWQAADRARRMEMARRGHVAICRRLRLWVPELFFEGSGTGPLIRRDPLTDRVVASQLLIDDPDPRGLVRALVQAHCYRARERLVRNHRWLRSSLWQRLRGRLRRADRDPESDGADQLDVLDLEPEAAARQVLEGFQQGT